MPPKSCCCGCSCYQAGSVTIGIVYLLSSLLQIYVGVLVAEDLKGPENEVLRNVMIYVACLAVVSASLSIMLVVGAVNKIPSLLRAWIIFECILYYMGIIIPIYITGGRNNLAGTFFRILINVYFFMVVEGYHTELKQQSGSIQTDILIERCDPPARTDVV